MLPCLRGGFACRLLPSSLSDADERAPRLARADDLVDVAERRRLVRVGEVVLVLLDEPGPGRGPLGLVGDLVEGAAVDDVDRALGAHHRDLGGGEREVHVGADVLRRHHVVGAAVGLARDDRDLRDRGLGEGVEELGAVLDDAAELLRRAGQEAGHVDERHQRDVEAVAEPHEARGLDRRVDVEAAGEVLGLVGDDPTGRPPSRAKPQMMFLA
jgi:hypothetical protein